MDTDKPVKHIINEAPHSPGQVISSSDVKDVHVQDVSKAI